MKVPSNQWSAISKYLFLFALYGILFVFCFSAESQQQPNQIPRIGYLSAYDKVSESMRAAGVRLALRELDYIEGQNIAIEYRYAEAKRERYPDLGVCLRNHFFLDQTQSDP